MDIIRATDEIYTQYWEQLWSMDRVQKPFYLPSSLKFVKEYNSEFYFEDLSFLICDDKIPVLSVMMAAGVSGERKILSAFGRPILYLVNEGISVSIRNRASKLMRAELDIILKRFEAYNLDYFDYLFDGALSELSKYILTQSANSIPYFTQVIKLCPSESELKSQVRKSYKSLINWGLKNLEIKILDFSNIEKSDFELFRKLHADVSGREVRSKRTWDLQYEMVINKEAFVIFGALDNELITAALFSYSDVTCYYGVSASKREYFDKPLLHAVMMRAIYFAKSIGCKYFEIGEQKYTNQGGNNVSDKELGISDFKRGFGGDTIVRLAVNIDIKRLNT